MKKLNIFRQVRSIRSIFIVVLALSFVLLPLVIAKENRLLEKAETAYKEKRYDDALELYQELYDDDSSSMKYVSGLVKVLKVNKQFTDAEQVLQEFLKRQPFAREAYLDLAEVFRKNLKFKESETVLNKLLRLYPKDQAIFAQYGYLKFDQKKYSEAIDYFNSSISLKPLSASTEMTVTRLKRARTNQILGLYEKSLEDLVFLSDKLPWNIELHFLLAETYFETKKVSEGKETLNYVIRISSNSAKNWTRMGTLYFKSLNDTSKAVESYQKALEVDPNYANARLMLAKVYESQSQWKEAEVQYTKLIRENRAMENALRGLIQIWKQQNRYAEVGRVLARYVAKNPNQGWAKLEYLRNLVVVEQEELALEFLDDHLKSHKGKDSSFDMARAYIHFKKNQFEEAVHILKEAAILYPSDDRLQFNLALSYEKSGKLAESKAIYEKVKASELVGNQANLNLALLDLPFEGPSQGKEVNRNIASESYQSIESETAVKEEQP